MSNIIPPHLLSPQDIGTLNSIRLQQPGLVAMLINQRDHIYTQMVATSDTVELHHLRGQAGVINRLIDLINESAAAADRLAQR